MTESTDRKSIVILGGPNTGKSHYAYQLYGRLRTGECNVKLRQSPESIVLFDAGLERLNQGLTAPHTTSGTYLECTLPLKLAERNIDVCWPDYDGEQLYRQVTQRRITQNWQNRLCNADAWMLFVRLAITQRHKDILANPLESKIPSANDNIEREENVESENDDELSGQAKVIELLQILLHATGADISRRTQFPVLGVVISCWDEMCGELGVTPDSLLGKHAPLIHQFLEANWAQQSRFIMGLSSTGKSLSEKTPDSDYREKGPESFGFTIDVNGEKRGDLTLPISKLLELISTNGR